MYKHVRGYTKQNVSLQHEMELEKYLSYLSDYGWRTFNMNGLAPDGIVVKNNVCCAVEILGSASGKLSSYSARLKSDQYSMFDRVMFHTFKYKKFDKRTEPISMKELLELIEES